MDEPQVLRLLCRCSALGVEVGYTVGAEASDSVGADVRMLAAQRSMTPSPLTLANLSAQTPLTLSTLKSVIPTAQRSVIGSAEVGECVCSGVSDPVGAEHVDSVDAEVGDSVEWKLRVAFSGAGARRNVGVHICRRDDGVHILGPGSR